MRGSGAASEDRVERRPRKELAENRYSRSYKKTNLEGYRYRVTVYGEV